MLSLFFLDLKNSKGTDINNKNKYSNPNIPFCTKKSIYILCSFANLSLLINSLLNC